MKKTYKKYKNLLFLTFKEESISFIKENFNIDDVFETLRDRIS
ncbi:hypothetical protein [Caminibacter profundus]